MDDGFMPPPAPFTGWKDGELQVGKGRVYTISRLAKHQSLKIWCATFKELPLRSDDDAGYSLSRFRPVIEQKDDIALFTHLLNTKSEDQPIKEEA